ncbi:MAG: DNA polymerase III subunit delta' [Actinomycetales bacterium]
MSVRIFNSLVDQERVTKALEDALVSAKSGSSGQEMTHAWLFTGPPGSGRSNAAKSFAAALVCKADGCGECTDCSTAINGTHPDVEILDVSGISIKIDEIRELVARSAWGASISNWRIVVIEDCDRMTEAAANALLKALEEPASQTVWLLCAPTLQDVLPTIRSRCRHLNLKTPNDSEITKFLINNLGANTKDAELAARISHGHIGRAKGFLKDSDFKETRKRYLDILFSAKDEASAIRAASKLLDLATDRATLFVSDRTESESETLKSALQGTSRGLVSGGAKAIKDLERDQKLRLNRTIKDEIDSALLDYSTLLRDSLVSNSNRINLDLNEEIDRLKSTTKSELRSHVLTVMSHTRELLTSNASQLMLLERMFLAFAPLNRGN